MAASSAIAFIIRNELKIMSSRNPVRVLALRGRVTQGEYGKGSKSEREAVFIETAGAPLHLAAKVRPRVR